VPEQGADVLEPRASSKRLERESADPETSPFSIDVTHDRLSGDHTLESRGAEGSVHGGLLVLLDDLASSFIIDQC
jgi:hypothetical protein